MVPGVLTGGVRGGVGLLPVALLVCVIRVGTSAHPTDEAGGSALGASAANPAWRRWWSGDEPRYGDVCRRVGTCAHAVSPVETRRTMQTDETAPTHHTDATTTRSANKAAAAAAGKGRLT